MIEGKLHCQVRNLCIQNAAALDKSLILTTRRKLFLFGNVQPSSNFKQLQKCKLNAFSKKYFLYSKNTHRPTHDES